MPKRYNGGSTFSLSYTPTGGTAVTFTLDTVTSYEPQWDWESETFENYDFSTVSLTKGRRFSCNITTGLLDSTDLTAIKAVLVKRALKFVCPDYPSGIDVYVQNISQPLEVSNFMGAYSRITISLAAVGIDGGSVSSDLIEYNNGTTWTAFTHCGNARYTKSIAGIGLGGIATASLTFEATNEAAPITAARVRISGTSTVFYINSRNTSRYVTSYECLDATAFLDQEIDVEHLSDSYFYTDPTTGEKFMNYGGSPQGFTNLIQDKCHMSMAGLPFLDNRGIPLELVQGKTFQQFLTDLSMAKGGFYSLDGSDQLQLITVPSPTPSQGDQPLDGKFSYVDVGTTFTANAVLVDDDPQYIIPNNYTVIQYNTLTAGGSCIKYADTTALGRYVGNYDCFKEWKCENALISRIPPLGVFMDFTPLMINLLRVTSVNVRWVGQTMVATLAGTIPENGEINRQPRYLSDIDEKVEENKVYGGNMMITPYQGIIYLEEDAQQEGAQS